LRELSVAVSNIHSQFNAVIGAAMQAPVERGEFLLSELKAALSFLFDDGVDDEQDAELERLSAAFSDTSSHDALAQSLDGFSYYAAKLRERLAELPEFDPGFIDEALVVARQLRAIGHQTVERRPRSPELALEVAKSPGNAADRAHASSPPRGALRYRNHPKLARRAASSYERRRRRQRLRAEAAKNASNGQQPETPAST
jgi:hypothetical protein